VTNRIAPEEIDGWLTYRLLKPIFNFYKHLGIYQRNLESFDQKVILEKDKFDQGCLNCHTPLNRKAGHLRLQHPGLRRPASYDSGHL
jgi:hypothetical protein